MSDDAPIRQKFKWTKELINIALNDGMTQEEIARVCRTQQSVVSSWKSGKNKATEQQLAEILRRYGARLNRSTARVYLAFQKPSGTWEESEIGARLLKLKARQVACNAQLQKNRDAGLARHLQAEQDAMKPREGEAPWPPSVRVSFGNGPRCQYRYEPTESENAEQAQIIEATNELRQLIAPNLEHCTAIDTLTKLYQEDFSANGPHRLVQVEGPILFRYTFCKLSGRGYRRGLDVAKEPIARWILHDLHRGKLLLVAQERRGLVGTARERERREFAAAQEEVARLAQNSSRMSIPPMAPSTTVECADDAGRWLSVVNGPMTAEEVLRWVEQFLSDPATRHTPHDEMVLPYLIRKALLEHGYPVPDVDRISGF